MEPPVFTKIHQIFFVYVKFNCLSNGMHINIVSKKKVRGHLRFRLVGIYIGPKFEPNKIISKFFLIHILNTLMCIWLKFYKIWLARTSKFLKKKKTTNISVNPLDTFFHFNGIKANQISKNLNFIYYQRSSKL